MNGTSLQKKWFEHLSDVIETPIYTARNKLENGKFRPGQQHLLGSQIPPIDHRTIGSNEIVIELDAKSFGQNSKYAKMINTYCLSQEIPIYWWWSGNKGLHGHIFLKTEIKNTEGQEIIRQALKKGCNIFKEIRLKIVEEIITQAGLSPKIIGRGKIVDLQKLAWNDLGGKNTLIRAEGGANKKVDKIDSTIITGGYKTYLENIPPNKPKDNDYDSVNYPSNIELYELDEKIPIEIAQTYLKIVKTVTTSDKPVNYTGKYLTLPCIQTIKEGLGPGQRSYGALTLSLACRLDNLSKDQNLEILKEYVRKCSQIPESFTIDEAKKWMDWVWRQPSPYWICGHCQGMKVCESHDCGLVQTQFKEEVELFENETPLKVVKRALDNLIVGEDELKIQLFLLYLTKEFKPEWCIMLEGAAATGKSHVMKKVALLFGEENEAFFAYSRITASVLNHAEVIAKKWAKKIVIIEELQGAKQVVEQLRILISEGKLGLLETIDEKMPDGTTRKVEHEKIIPFDCLFVTCNAEEEDEGEQLASRSWILNTDNSTKQTAKIVDYYLDEFSLKEEHMVPNLQVIRTALSFLKRPFKIIFPYADQLVDFLPTSNVRARRDIKKFITLIKASAYLHQKDRIWVKDAQGRDILYADWRDVYIVIEYCGGALNASTQGLGQFDIKYYEVILANIVYVPEFTIDDVSRWCQVNISCSRKLMSNLLRAGLFENTKQFGQKANYVRTLGNITPYFDKRGLIRAQILKQGGFRPAQTCSDVHRPALTCENDENSILSTIKKTCEKKGWIFEGSYNFSQLFNGTSSIFDEKELNELKKLWFEKKDEN